MARPRKNPLTLDKICPTCKKTFTISSRKYRQIFCNRSCANHNPIVLEKMAQSQQKTWDEKYNGLHPMQTEETVENFKKSLFKNNGNDYYKNYLVKKTKESNLKNHGDENYNNIEQVKKTCLEKYGVDNISKSSSVIEARSKTVKENHYKFILDFCEKENIEFLCKDMEYAGYHFSKIYKFKCNKCNHIFENTIYNLKHLFCEKCDPNRKDTIENEIFDFLTTIFDNKEIIKRRDRTLLNGKELDFYIPSKKLAIELNGLYWHSEIGGKINKQYHLYKTKSCIFHGIKLIHIFETEWVDKKDIVKSVIRNSIGMTETKIYARDCELRETSNEEKSHFLTNNHIQGNDKNSIQIGLFNNDEIVSVMTFCKSRFDKSCEYEMSRFCNKLNTSIIGGASKLFSYFMNTYKPKSIVSYSDRRYFGGNVYQKLGFSFVNFTTPSYYYIVNKYKTLLNRMHFQKHKLEKMLNSFDSSLTEWENMQVNGFDRIWDCGHSKWILKTNY